MSGEDLHEFLFGAVRAKDVTFIGDKTLADERAAAHSTDEALIMPIAILKGNETSATDSC